MKMWQGVWVGASIGWIRLCFHGASDAIRPFCDFTSPAALAAKEQIPQWMWDYPDYLPSLELLLIFGPPLVLWLVLSVVGQLITRAWTWTHGHTG
jgi:hypothetical protein